jgi:hypothetical protein
MSCFILSTKTASAHVNPPLLAIYSDGNPMNIGQPTPLDSFLRVAYIVPELNPFAANITLHRRPLPLYYNSYLSYHINDTTSGKGEER